MMKLITLLLLLSINAFGGDIVISKDTTVNNTWVIPATTILRFETGGHISGTGTISGGILQASYLQDIFDTTITVGVAGLYGDRFSARWFGANPNNADNYKNLQKTINTCLSKWWMWIPQGKYTYKTTLFVGYLYNGNYVGVSLKMTGESNFWRSDNGTILEFLPAGTSGYALGLQQNKGSEFAYLNFKGGWVSPGGTDSVYYNTTLANYVDQSAKGYQAANYRGIGIDVNANPDGSGNGSTGLHFHDINVEKFGLLICVSRNGTTYNGDVLLFENLHLGDAREAFVSCQGQEKGNVIRGLYEWGSIHTLFSSGNHLNGEGGGYTLDGGNIAGRCIRMFNIVQRGWQQIIINNFFAETIGTIGTIGGSIPIDIRGCTFDFAYPYNVGYQTLLTAAGPNVMFTSCTFRYFGQTYPMKFDGRANYVNCIWSGAYQNNTPNSRTQVISTSPVGSDGRKIEL